MKRKMNSTLPATVSVSMIFLLRENFYNGLENDDEDFEIEWQNFEIDGEDEDD